MSNYVYIRSEPGCYTVGFYRPNGVWESESDYSSTAEAAARVHYLNGGAAPGMRINGHPNGDPMNDPPGLR